MQTGILFRVTMEMHIFVCMKYKDYMSRLMCLGIFFDLYLLTKLKVTFIDDLCTLVFYILIKKLGIVFLGNKTSGISNIVD